MRRTERICTCGSSPSRAWLGWTFLSLVSNSWRPKWAFCRASSPRASSRQHDAPSLGLQLERVSFGQIWWVEAIQTSLKINTYYTHTHPLTCEAPLGLCA